MHHHHASSPSPSSYDTKADDEPPIIYSTDAGMPVRVMPDDQLFMYSTDEGLTWLPVPEKKKFNASEPQLTELEKGLLQHIKTRDAEQAEERKKNKEEEKTKTKEDEERYKQNIEAANASMPRPTLKRLASSMPQASYPAMPCKGKEKMVKRASSKPCQAEWSHASQPI